MIFRVADSEDLALLLILLGPLALLPAFRLWRGPRCGQGQALRVACGQLDHSSGRRGLTSTGAGRGMGGREGGRGWSAGWLGWSGAGDKDCRLPLLRSRRHQVGRRQRNGVLGSREQAQSQELALQIVCARDGNPMHGQQVILTVYRDLTPGGTEGIFTRGEKANAQWIDTPDGRGKLSPTKCRREPAVHGQNPGA